MKGVHSGSKNGMYGKTPPNTKRIKVFSEKHTGQKEFIVKSSYEKRFVDMLNEDASTVSFSYEPKEFRVFYKDGSINRSYQPDFLINGKEVIEIKNTWNAGLKETKEKEIAFRNHFQNINYKILTLSRY